MQCWDRTWVTYSKAYTNPLRYLWTTQVTISSFFFAPSTTSKSPAPLHLESCSYHLSTNPGISPEYCLMCLKTIKQNNSTFSQDNLIYDETMNLPRQPYPSIHSYPRHLTESLVKEVVNKWMVAYSRSPYQGLIVLSGICPAKSIKFNLDLQILPFLLKIEFNK